MLEWIATNFNNALVQNKPFIEWIKAARSRNCICIVCHSCQTFILQFKVHSQRQEKRDLLRIKKMPILARLKLVSSILYSICLCTLGLKPGKKTFFKDKLRLSAIFWEIREIVNRVIDL